MNICAFVKVYVLTAVATVCVLFFSLTAETQTFIIDVRVGDEATLPCEDRKDFNDNCYSTTWLYRDSSRMETLFEYGKIRHDTGVKSLRLGVTADCLLVLKNITNEDAGCYACIEFNSSGHQVSDFRILLFVIGSKYFSLNYIVRKTQKCFRNLG